MRFNRNTRVGILLIVVAFIIGVFWTIGKNRAQVQVVETPVPTTTVALPPANQVAVARVNIPARSIITPDMLVMKDGANLNDSDRENRFVTDVPRQAEGYVTSRPIAAGAKIDRTADFVGHITEVGIAGTLNPGFRAMVIPIPNRGTLHDLVKVGDFVDIVGAFDAQESRTIVQNRRVLAVDVFANEYPKPFPVAQRGDYRAAPKGSDLPPPPPPGSPEPTPTPAPNNGQPPAVPAAALTLELTPDDVTAISLANAVPAPLDFVLHPRPALVGVQDVRVATMTRARIAPYANRVKSATPPRPAAASSAPSTSRNSNGGGGRRYTGPDASFPMPQPLPPVNPGTLQPPAPSKPETYDIPIYGDGKMTRIDTVRKPEATSY